jgi:hypothetical protein
MLKDLRTNARRTVLGKDCQITHTQMVSEGFAIAIGEAGALLGLTSHTAALRDCVECCRSAVFQLLRCVIRCGGRGKRTIHRKDQRRQMGGKGFRKRKWRCHCGFRFLGHGGIKMGQNIGESHHSFSGCRTSFGLFLRDGVMFGCRGKP